MKEILFGSIACSLCNKLIKKDIFNNDIIYPTFSMAEDLTISPQLIYFSNSIGHINKALYHYCKNTESITNANSTQKISQKTNQYIGNINLLFKFIERGNILLPKYIIATIKYRCREWIVPIINTSYGYNLWKNTFPELNKTFIFYKEFSIKSRLSFILYYLRLSFIKKPYHFLHKIFTSNAK